MKERNQKMNNPVQRAAKPTATPKAAVNKQEQAKKLFPSVNSNAIFEDFEENQSYKEMVFHPNSHHLYR